MRVFAQTNLLAFVLSCISVSAGLATEPLDVLIQGGRIVDGAGAPWYHADVGIRDGRIVTIGRLANETGPEKSAGSEPASKDRQGAAAGAMMVRAARTIDARGLVVAPGFIDMMGQSASSLLDNPASASNLLAQGVTTILCGEGVSAAPATDEQARRVPWKTMAEYFLYLDMKGMPLNVVQTIGHTQARLIVLGDVERRPVGDELERMKALVREGMEAGAIGLSTSLIYPPAVYADTQEIAALAGVSGEFGGRYFTHMRNEGDRLLEAIDEALEIGRTAGTPVHIFHLKAAGRDNWPKMEQAIARIQTARDAGQQVTADIYPYVNNGLGIAAFIPPKYFAEGEAKLLARLGDPKLRQEIRAAMESDTTYENWYRHIGRDWGKVVIGSAADAKYSAHAGKSLADMAQALGEDPWDTFFSLVAARAFALPESMSEENLERAMRREFISFCTDVGPAGGSRIASHPRAFGAFPRILARYVRERKTLSLERAVAQASTVAANEVMAYDRGRIAVGLAADLAIFEPTKIVDRATFSAPQTLAEGMRFVLVNGELVWDEGKQTNKRPGRVLRRPGTKSGPPQSAASQNGPTTVAANSRGVESLERFMDEFLERHRVPGCAVAVARGDQLLYARGFGWADVAAREPVTPQTLFRIASISKPVTAVAILRLVESGKLRLDDFAYDLVKEPPHVPQGSQVEERLAKITVRQLLQHRGGWDRDKSFDAMFQSVRFAKSLGVAAPAGPREVIRCMYCQPLDFAPGERYAYSNFGYCLLGRIVERASGESYEEFTRREILAPAGANTMQLGRTLLKQRRPGETRYYDPAMGVSVFEDDVGQPSPQPYGAWNLEAMDAHGGWLASSIDLVRFAAALDLQSPRRLLKPESVAEMLRRPTEEPELDADGQPKAVHYGLGWFVRPVGAQGAANTWHTGSLPGTSTILIRRHDGLHIAVLFNSRVSPWVDHLTKALDTPDFHGALDRVTSWPAQPLWSSQP